MKSLVAFAEPLGEEFDIRSKSAVVCMRCSCLFMAWLVRESVRWFVCWFIHVLVRRLVYWFVCQFGLGFVCELVRLLINFFVWATEC